MNPLKRMTETGVEWIYRPGVVYTAEYQGFNVNIRRVLARSAETGNPWRLHVNRNHGGSLTYGHQFWPTVKAARTEGKRLVDQYKAATSA